MAKASIIIVTYNGLQEYTIPCLQSIFSQTVDIDFEVIVVDNNSTDGTPAYLMKLAESESRLRPVLNPTNRGFARGNNDGLRIAKGDYLVMLNSDTLVTDGWLKRLIETLRSDSSIGLVGPVSNSTGNEQTVFTDAGSPPEIITQGLAWSAASQGDSFACQKLCFFCIATRRDVIEKVGALDESFGQGFYEDDDYCLRVAAAGFRLVCREDVFIYHRWSASFREIPTVTKQLLKRNRRILEKKIGGPYRTRHPRDRHLDLAEAYLGQAHRAEDRERMLYKTDRRLRQAELIAPHGIFKKIGFTVRLRKIMRMKSLLSPLGQEL